MEKKLYELTIDEEFEHMMPPLQDIELNLLTQSLLDEGCRDSIITWNGVVIDGHNRYRICHENNIPFNYIEMEFSNRDDAKLWILHNQLSRRNLNDFQRIEVTYKCEDAVKAEAKKRQMSRLIQNAEKKETPDVPKVAQRYRTSYIV